MNLNELSEDDRNILIACADLVGRVGASSFEIGYVHDDVLVEEAGWYAHAQYQGARITEEGSGPIQAADALVRRILTGAKCRCGKLVNLDQPKTFAYADVGLADGTRWTAQDAERAGQCVWRRTGQRWEPSCPILSGRF